MESTVLINNDSPISIFSEIHSSKEKDFISINTITFSAIEGTTVLFQKAAFIIEYGYDNNKLFLKLDYIIV